MKILLIGSGGREHALAWALAKSDSLDKLFCVPGNPGMAAGAEFAELNADDHNAVAVFCRKNDIDLVVVGPEQPLAEGIADFLRERGISVFGPDKAAAMLEASKGFAKKFMDKFEIPTAAYKQFRSNQAVEAHLYIDSQSLPIVLKADGLAAGKGVIIAETHLEAHSALDEMFDGLFKSAGEKVVIEQFLNGDEASVLAVCDGENYVTLAPSQDHKRALDGDKGKNTGGMGAYAPAPLLTEEILEKVKARIIEPTLRGMKQEGASFIGCLYAGLMIDNGEPYVVEFNVRFGDPETQAVLAVLDADLPVLLKSAADGNLQKNAVRNIADGAACCVILASDGYPDSYQKGFPISGIEDAERDGAVVFHAGTAVKDGELINTGGRVLGVCGKAANLSDAVKQAYAAVEKIHFENKFYRTDIAKKAL